MLARIDNALPRDHAPPSAGSPSEINDAVAAFIRGQGAICLVLGIFYAAGLSWAGIDYGLLIGLTTGLLAFIPIVGWMLGLILRRRCRHRAVLAGPRRRWRRPSGFWSSGICHRCRLSLAALRGREESGCIRCG